MHVGCHVYPLVGAHGQATVQSTKTTAGGNNKGSQHSHNTLMNEAVQHSVGLPAAQRVGGNCYQERHW